MVSIFDLPNEVIQHIFEYDNTYINIYNDNMELLDRDLLNSNILKKLFNNRISIINKIGIEYIIDAKGIESSDEKNTNNSILNEIIPNYFNYLYNIHIIQNEYIFMEEIKCNIFKKINYDRYGYTFLKKYLNKNVDEKNMLTLINYFDYSDDIYYMTSLFIDVNLFINDFFDIYQYIIIENDDMYDKNYIFRYKYKDNYYCIATVR